MIWRVRRHMAVQIQRFCQCSCTKDHISSTSRISSAWAGRSVSSSSGLCSSFFEPTRQRITADPEGTLNTAHAGTFVGVGSQNLLFLFWCVTMFWFQDTTFTALFTPVLLTAIGIMTVLDDVLASACSTTVDDGFCNHMPRLSHFT